MFSIVFFKNMATPDISKLIQVLNEKERQVLTLNSTKALNDSTLCDELSVIIRNDQAIKQELDSIQLQIASLLNSKTLSHDNIELQDMSKIEQILNVSSYYVNGTGIAAGVLEHQLYVQKNMFSKHVNWRGQNGVWYNTELNPRFYGNQYTGKRKNIINNKLGKLGTGLFWIGTVYSSAQLINGIYHKDDYKIVKSSVDIIIGCIASYGGPPGWIIGGMYLLMDLGGAFDNAAHKSNTSHDFTIAPRDNTYVVAPKIPHILFKK